MKIWVTYSSAGSLWSGGLERCRVWFSKPRYLAEYYEPGEELAPWFNADPKSGLRNVGWSVQSGNMAEVSSISWGRVFGYCDRDEPGLNELSEKVWDKICAHFQNKPLGKEWQDLEHSGQVLSKDFLLELDVEIKPAA